MFKQPLPDQRPDLLSMPTTMRKIYVGEDGMTDQEKKAAAKPKKTTTEKSNLQQLPLGVRGMGLSNTV